MENRSKSIRQMTDAEIGQEIEKIQEEVEAYNKEVTKRRVEFYNRVAELKDEIRNRRLTNR